MSDELNEYGLQTKSLSDLTTELEENYQEIYGDDINIDTNSPDGQKIDIEAQAGIDLREILAQVNSGFDPDQAAGRVLDQRVAINGISRNEGTFTYQNIEIITSKALNLVGLDDDATTLSPDISNLFTVKDDSGTEFYLLSSQEITEAGTFSLNFRAAELGLVEVSVNTLTTAETIITGVTSVNNPSSANSIGTDEETDAELKARRKISTAISSTGFLDGLEGALNDLDNVTTALVYENDTNSEDSNGTPAHTIWCIVEGGDPDDIAATIYAKKSGGCGMRGDQEVSVERTNNRTYTVNYDEPGNEDLYIRFSVESSDTVDSDAIKTDIIDNITWDIGANADAGTVTSQVKSLNSNYVITGMVLSNDNSTWLEVVSISSVQNRFTMSEDNIEIL